MPVLTATDFRAIPAGEYQARIRRIEPGEGTYGPYLKFEFEIMNDPDYAGEIIFALASETFSPKSKLRGWVQTLTGRTFEEGDPFDTDDILRLPCRISLTVESTEGGERNKVISVLPPNRPPKAPKPAPAQTTRQQTYAAAVNPPHAAGPPPATQATRSQARRQPTPPPEDDNPFDDGQTAGGDAPF